MNEGDAPGAYAFFCVRRKLTAMAVSVSTIVRFMAAFSPRCSITKYSPVDAASIRWSQVAIARYLAWQSTTISWRATEFQITGDGLKQEGAWNYGMKYRAHPDVCGVTLKLNAEYYYTDFKNQAVVIMN